MNNMIPPVMVWRYNLSVNRNGIERMPMIQVEGNDKNDSDWIDYVNTLNDLNKITKEKEYVDEFGNTQRVPICFIGRNRPFGKNFPFVRENGIRYWYSDTEDDEITFLKLIREEEEYGKED